MVKRYQLKNILCLQLLLLPVFLWAQNIGTKVAVVGVDGKTYTGVVQEIIGNRYKIKYDGYDVTAMLAINQFSIIQGNTGYAGSGYYIGAKVKVPAKDGKIYTGVIKENSGNAYKIKYDGYNTEEWLLTTQFTIDNAAAKPTTVAAQPQTTTPIKNTGTDASALRAIFDFGRQKGWAQELYNNKFTAFANKLTAEQTKTVVVFLQKANTASARFFALKSLLTGDSYEVVQNFIQQLNQYPETYQQENCVATSRKSIIQQWEFSCSVTAVQTYLADLSPRYAWEVKQIPNFNIDAHDPHHPMAEQQKQLLEKYGGAISPRGDMTGRSIGIIGPLNELVGPIIGAKYYAQEIAPESLTTVFSKIRNVLDKGLCEPLLIGFVGTQSRHFILVMRYKQVANGYQYLIYDPWDGVCDYVSESSITQGSLAPLLTQWKISIDYYYPIQ